MLECQPSKCIALHYYLCGLCQTESSSDMEKPSKRMHSSSKHSVRNKDAGPSKVRVEQMLQNAIS